MKTLRFLGKCVVYVAGGIGLLLVQGAAWLDEKLEA